jgi:hypothetical protein
LSTADTAFLRYTTPSRSLSNILPSDPLIDSVESVIALEKNHHQAFGSLTRWFTESPVHPRYPTDIFTPVS